MLPDWLLAVISQLYLTSYELPKCQLTKNHIVFGQTEAWSRSNWLQSLFNTIFSECQKLRLVMCHEAFVLIEMMHLLNIP